MSQSYAAEREGNRLYHDNIEIESTMTSRTAEQDAQDSDHEMEGDKSPHMTNRQCRFLVQVRLKREDCDDGVLELYSKQKNQLLSTVENVENAAALL